MPKTAKGLVEYCRAQLGTPYWYGTFGNYGTEAFYNQKKRQYPGKYTTAYDPSHTTKKVHDCVGLIKGYLWCDSPHDGTPVYNSAQDKSANGMYNSATVKGPISTMPDKLGVLVHMDGHIGVYIGGGEVIEARGRAYGTVQTKLKDRPWGEWCECPFITYEAPAPTPAPKEDSTLELLKKFIHAVEALPEYKDLSGLLED